VSFEIIVTTSVSRHCFSTQHQTCRTKTIDQYFWSQTGLVLRPTVSDHITDNSSTNLPTEILPVGQNAKYRRRSDYWPKLVEAQVIFKANVTKTPSEILMSIYFFFHNKFSNIDFTY